MFFDCSIPHSPLQFLQKDMARKYYYDTGEKKIGPVNGTDLLRLRQQGEIQNNTWVRRAESSTWRELQNVDLREEEEKQKNPSLLRALLSNLSWSSILGLILLLVFIVAMIVLVGIVAFKLLPFIVAILAVWLIYRAVR